MPEQPRIRRNLSKIARIMISNSILRMRIPDNDSYELTTNEAAMPHEPVQGTETCLIMATENVINLRLSHKA